jgi:restriction endonuclease S subunit
MNQYPTYKDSGVDWLGDIPAHWGLSKLKHVAYVNPTKGRSEYDKESDEEATFLPMGHVSEDGRIDTSIRKPVRELWSGFTYFEEGDAIVAKITPCFENGKGAHLRNLGSPVGFGSTEFHVLRPRDGISDGRFLYYLVFSHIFRATGEAFMEGAGGQKRVPTSFVEEFSLGLPPLNEQRQLAAYLDRKTGEIDTLIRKKRALIGLLREQRAALIHRAVTKGLDPNVTMKGSGDDGIGEIPAAWDMVRIKRIAEIENSGVWGDEPDVCDAPVPVITTADITKDHRLLPDSIRHRCLSEDDWARYRCNHGDILVVKSSGSIDNVSSGKAAYVENGGEYAFSNFLMRVRSHRETAPKYLFYVLTSHLTRERVLMLVSTTTYPNLKVDEYVGFSVPMPSRSEQERIVEYLDRRMGEIADLVERESRSIELLQALRTSLISEVITGKVDVREVARSVDIASGTLAA